MGLSFGISMGGVKRARDQARQEVLQDEKLDMERDRHGLEMEKGEFALEEGRRKSEQDEWRYGAEQEDRAYEQEYVRPHEEWRRENEQATGEQLKALNDLRIKGAKRADALDAVVKKTKIAVAREQDQNIRRQATIEGVKAIQTAHTEHLGDVFKAYKLFGGAAAAKMLNDWPLYTSEDVADVVERDGQLMAVDAEGNVVEDPTHGPLVMDAAQAEAAWGGKQKWGIEGGVMFEENTGQVKEIPGGGGGMTRKQMIDHAMSLDKYIRQVAVQNHGTLGDTFSSLTGMQREKTATDAYFIASVVGGDITETSVTNANKQAQDLRRHFETEFEDRGLSGDKLDIAVNAAMSEAADSFRAAQPSREQATRAPAAEGTARSSGEPVILESMADPRLKTLQVGDTFVAPDGRHGRVTPRMYEAIHGAQGATQGQGQGQAPFEAPGGAQAAQQRPAQDRNIRRLSERDTHSSKKLNRFLRQFTPEPPDIVHPRGRRDFRERLEALAEKVESAARREQLMAEWGSDPESVKLALLGPLSERARQQIGRFLDEMYGQGKVQPER